MTHQLGRGVSERIGCYTCKDGGAVSGRGAGNSTCWVVSSGASAGDIISTHNGVDSVTRTKVIGIMLGCQPRDHVSDDLSGQPSLTPA